MEIRTNETPLLLPIPLVVPDGNNRQVQALHLRHVEPGPFDHLRYVRDHLRHQRLVDLRERNKVLNELTDDQIYHVYPNFGREHVTDKRGECWCQPKAEFVSGGVIFIHEAEQ